MYRSGYMLESSDLGKLVGGSRKVAYPERRRCKAGAWRVDGAIGQGGMIGKVGVVRISKLQNI